MIIITLLNKETIKVEKIKNEGQFPFRTLILPPRMEIMTNF